MKKKLSRIKINMFELAEDIRQGMTTSDAAKKWGVTPGAISQRKARLEVGIVKDVALESAHLIVGKNLDAVSQLQEINRHANRLLKAAMGKVKPNPDVALEAMREIRGQLKLQLEIFQALFDLKAVEAFQQEVLEIIGEVDANVRREIISRLKERKTVRSAFSIS